MVQYTKSNTPATRDPDISPHTLCTISRKGSFEGPVSSLGTIRNTIDLGERFSPIKTSSLVVKE